MDVAIGGCMREVPPCAPWGGLRDQLRALAQRQQSGPGDWEALVVITGTPRWAAAGPSLCDREGTAPRSRAPRREALGAYAGLVRAVTAEAEAQGARLRYWSPWNEPNHPYFLSPQDCPGRAGPVEGGAGGGLAPVAAYTRLARAMREALAPEQRLVLGELAGLYRRSTESVTVREFLAALPSDVVCSAAIWGQHAYVGGRDPVDDAARGLRRHRCERPHDIWITETGARNGTCGQMHQRLVRWWRDPRVSAAFQYTLREDDRYRTGLVTTALDAPLPALGLWQAWGARERRAAPPPRPSGCP